MATGVDPIISVALRAVAAAFGETVYGRVAVPWPSGDP